MEHRRASNNIFIMERISWTSIAGILLLCLSLVDGYSKYGRSCNDIGCRSNEECVMAEDPCPLYRPTECGRYPTCSPKNAGGSSCRTTQCPVGKYCKTVDGQPTCVETSPQLDFESAGVSSINGQRTNSNIDNRQNPNNNVNPYANANAPPPEHRDIGINNNYPSSVNSGGYPAYPSNTGYSPQRPPPSRSETDLGYPPYPTNNRSPPQPGYYPPPQPNYPAYPNYNDINNNNNHNRPRGPYYRSAGLVNLPNLTLGLTNLLLLLLLMITN